MKNDMSKFGKWTLVIGGSYFIIRYAVSFIFNI